MAKQSFITVLFVIAVSGGFSSAAFDPDLNLVANGDFEESTNFNSWFTGGGQLITTDNGPSLPGTNCAELNNTGTTNTRDLRSRGMDIVAGTQYRLTFDYKTLSGSIDQPQIRFRFFDGGIDDYGNTKGNFKGEAQRGLAQTDDAWQSEEIIFTAPDGSNVADINFTASIFGSFSGVVRVDNFVVNPETSGDQARNPDPSDGAIDVELEKVLTWSAPLEIDAVSYNIYFGIDPNDNNMPLEATITDPNITAFDPDLEINTTYYWRVDTVTEESVDAIRGELWSFTTIPPKAYGPDPANGQTGVAQNKELSWSAAPGAQSHEIYFGTDEALVQAGDESVNYGYQVETTFAPDMAFETQYFWRIDEILDRSSNQGDVWTFTTSAPVCDPPLAHDSNNDCVVDMADLAQLASEWLSCTLINGYCP